MPQNRSKQNGSGPYYEHLPGTLLPSIFIPEGRQVDVVNKFHLLLLVVYLLVLASCLLLALGILLVGYTVQ